MIVGHEVAGELLPVMALAVAVCCVQVPDPEADEVPVVVVDRDRDVGTARGTWLAAS